MFTKHRKITVALVICVILLGVIGIYANTRSSKLVKPKTTARVVEQKIPSNPPKVSTKFRNQAEFEKGLYQFHYRTIVGAYKQYGIHDPKWDNAAIKFLEGFVRSEYEKDSKVNTDAVMAEGKSLLDMGCNDPLVKSSYGILLRVVNQKEAYRLLDESLAEFERSKYPKCRARIIPFHLYDLGKVPGQAKTGDEDKWRKRIIDLSAESLRDGSYLPGEQRFVLESFAKSKTTMLFISYETEMPDSEWGIVYPEIKNDSRVDPYLKNVIGAYYYRVAATKVNLKATNPRDMINTDMDKTLKGRDMLIKAWKLHPEFPDAPAMMAAYAKSLMMIGSNLEDPVVWFERARAAQFDYWPAYTYYINYLEPEWGGSYDKMYDFGIKCVQSGRFDTNVPFYFMNILKKIRGSIGNYDLDQKTARAYWTSEKTGKYMNMMYEGYAKSQFNHPAEYWQTQNAAVAWYCERYSDARKSLDKLGDKVDRQLFLNDNDVLFSGAKEDIYLLGSPYASQIKKARELVDASKFKEALIVYRGVLRKVNDDKLLAELIRERINIIASYVDFGEGKWGDFMPGSEFIGWAEDSGDWSVEADGTLNGIQETNYARLFCNVPFGKQIEIKGEVEFSKIPCELGIFLNVPSVRPGWSEQHTGVVFDRSGKSVEMGRQGFSDQRDSINDVTFKDTAEFLIQQWDNELTIYVDGKLLKKGIKTELKKDYPHMYIGVGGKVWDNSKPVYRFKKLQVRKLTQKPS